MNLEKTLENLDLLTKAFSSLLNMGDHTASAVDSAGAAAFRVSEAMVQSSAAAQDFSAAVVLTSESIELQIQSTSTLTTASASFAKAIATTANELDRMGSSAEQVVQPLAELKEAVAQMTDSTLSAAESMNAMSEKVSEAAESVREMADSASVTTEALGEITEATQAASAGLEEVASGTDALAEGTKKAEESTGALWKVLERASELGTSIADWLMRPLDRVQQMLQGLGDKASSGFGKIKDNAKQLADLFMAPMKRVQESFKGFGETIATPFQKAGELIKGFAGKVAGVFQKAGKLIQGFADKAKASFENVVKSLKSITGKIQAFWKSAMITDAMAEQTLAVKMDTVFEDGSASIDWARNQAAELGRSVQEVADSTLKFSGFTGSESGMSGLTQMADQIARFSDSGSFEKATEALVKGMQGDMSDLAAEMGIAAETLNQIDVKQFGQNGDVEGFISSLQDAAEQAGVTREAYEKMLSTPQAQLDRLTSSIKNGLAQAGGAFLDAFQPAFEKLNEFFQSDKGKALFAGLAAIMSTVGQVAELVVDKLVDFGTFLSDNLTTVIQGASLALAVFAGYMLASAIASLAAAWPLLLIIGLLVAIILVVQSMGYSMADVFEFVGGLIGGVFATLWNIIVDVWNLIAGFAEFFANVFHDPIGASLRLFMNFFDTVLGILQTIAEAIDFVTRKTDLAGGMQSFRDRVSSLVDEAIGEPENSIPRLERKNLQDSRDQFAGAGRKLGESLDNFNLDEVLDSVGSLGGENKLFGGEAGLAGAGSGLGGLKEPIGVDIQRQSKDICLDDEDLRMLVDMAERDYVAQVNMHQIAPVIKTEIYNNGGEPVDQQIAKVIQNVLDEQSATHTQANYV